jgi:hypothetical protein
MKNLSIKRPEWMSVNKHIEYVLLGVVAVLVLEFRTLELWEQLKFSVALFALLFLGAIGVLIAVL